MAEEKSVVIDYFTWNNKYKNLDEINKKLSEDMIKLKEELRVEKEKRIVSLKVTTDFVYFNPYSKGYETRKLGFFKLKLESPGFEELNIDRDMLRNEFHRAIREMEQDNIRYITQLDYSEIIYSKSEAESFIDRMIKEKMEIDTKLIKIMLVLRNLPKIVKFFIPKKIKNIMDNEKTA